MRPFFALALGAFALSANGATDIPTADPRELPRFPAVEPRDAGATFSVKHGFHLDLVASEPQISSPVAVTFDENGRLFVLEMRDYSEQRDQQPHLGQIRLLEDTDRDGTFDRATVFADNLPWPTAIIWARGAIYVCAAPDVWRIEDADGDGRAEARQLLFTGFNSGTPKLNVQALPKCFAWGPDNRIHLQTGGGNRGIIRCAARPELPAEELGGRDFWFDPRTLGFGFESGGGQFGMSLDNAGIRFVCNNSDHLRAHLFDARYLARNRFAAVQPPLVSIAADGPAAEVFRISPDEPWRVIRTRWRVAGKVSGPVEGGGRVSGYFTGATGTTVYRGDAFGAEFVGNTFTGDAGGNLVHRKRLRANGVSFVGERPEDERRQEFVASRDTWFRPVNFANTPDGALYIVDMYREVIEHPWSLPETIKQHLDLTSGRDRGRIWRITPDGFKTKPPPQLGAASIEELVATLSHPNGWHRDTATRLLWEKRDASATAPLIRLLTNGESALGRVHALRALDGLDALTPDIIENALTDRDASVREHAIRLAERFQRDGQFPQPILAALAARQDDDAPRVRLQLALTLGGSDQEGARAALIAIARRDGSENWIRAALRTARPEQMSPLFHALAAESGVIDTASGSELLSAMARAIGSRGETDEIQRVFMATTPSESHWPIAAMLMDGIEAGGKNVDATIGAKQFVSLLERAREIVRAPAGKAPIRAAACALLARARAGDALPALLDALRGEPPSLVATAAFAALQNIPETPGELLKQWPALSPAVRELAVKFLIKRPETARALLDAVKAGKIAKSDLPAPEQSALQQHRDKTVAIKARELFPVQIVEARAEALKRYQSAAGWRGDRVKGHTVFTQRCAICHRFRGEGNAFGPDLESVASGGKEKILAHILEPDREVAPQFAAYVAELNDGTSIAGIVASETAETVVVKEPLGKEQVLPRARVVRLQTTGRSPMPEGLESGLSVEEMAGLLEFITTGDQP
jgi:putative membrane-bound dehydrogenase-like protein